MTKLTGEQLEALHGALFDELQIHQRNGEGGDESYFAVQCEELMVVLRELQQLRTTGKELLESFEEVLRISDRNHDAWNRARSAISSHRAGIGIEKG